MFIENVSTESKLRTIFIDPQKTTNYQHVTSIPDREFEGVDVNINLSEEEALTVQLEKINIEAFKINAEKERIEKRLLQFQQIRAKQLEAGEAKVYAERRKGE